MKNLFFISLTIVTVLSLVSCSSVSKNKTLVTELSYPYYESVVFVYEDGTMLSYVIEHKEAAICKKELKQQVSNFPVGDKKLNGTIMHSRKK
ncbi:MAG: hypothetical protein ACK5N8_05215 [Alphaproteobacteria bacterium]